MTIAGTPQPPSPVAPTPTAEVDRRPPRRSLRRKFVLAIAALVGLVLAALATVQAITSRRQLRADIEDHATAYAALAVRPLCEAYETYYASGYGKFKTVAQDLMRLEHDLLRVSLYDTTGRLLFDSAELADPLFDPGQREKSAPVADPELRAAAAAMTTATWQRGDGYQVMAPYLEDWGRHRYSVLFEVSYASLRATARAAAWRILALTIAALGLAVGIAMLLARQSLGPVEVLTRGARDLADGQLARRIELSTGDEFESLAATFNLMAGRLQGTVSDLERSNRELAELDRLKSDLLANVSHELRTPLTAIQGYAEAIGDELLGPANAAQREALAVVTRNTVRLRGMIDQLLNYSRLDAGAIRVELEPLDLATIAGQAVANARTLAPPGVSVRVDAPADLPLALGDPARLAQVIENLLTNGIKFTPTGEIVVALRQVVDSAGPAIEVAVRDTGVGIPIEQQARIFDRFYQVDGSSTRRYGGMGLGLAIVREILAAHGSAIAVDSTVGQGTTFRFRLPLAPAVDRSRALTAARTVAVRRLLLVDDDAVFLSTVASLLGRHGYHVETATTIAGGLAAVAARHPDLVLLDRLLPDGDGFDLLTSLGADPATANIPVLVVSIRDERALGLKLGAAGYLVKPIDPGSLRQAVAAALPGYPFAPPDARPPGAGSGLEGASASTGPLVLVVDDEPDLRELLATRLRADGVRVATAADGHAALALLAGPAETLPQLVLLDLMMPGVDGWHVLRRLRAQETTRDLPVIVLTARDSPQDRATGAELGVADYIHKPFDLGALVREIEGTLASHPPTTPDDAPLAGGSH